MAVYTLPLPTSSTPRLSYKVTLDGAEYKLYFQWLIRNGVGWHLSVYDNADNTLLSNIKLIPWFSLLDGYPRTGLPLGVLGLTCLSQAKPYAPEMTLENLSTDFELLYYSVE